MNKTPILLFLRRWRCSYGAAVVAVALLGACASPVPRAIQEQPKPSLQLAEVRTGALPVDTRVRWGGTIATLEHKANESWLEIVERPLDRDGRPLRGDRSGGRFLVRIAGFLEPTVYKDGRLITVSGILEARERRRIGDYEYDYVIVKAQDYYLWPRQAERRNIEPAPYGWYDPWYPRGYPWGWWGYPYYDHHHHPAFAY